MLRLSDVNVTLPLRCADAIYSCGDRDDVSVTVFFFWLVYSQVMAFLRSVFKNLVLKFQLSVC